MGANDKYKGYYTYIFSVKLMLQLFHNRQINIVVIAQKKLLQLFFGLIIHFYINASFTIYNT